MFVGGDALSNGGVASNNVWRDRDAYLDGRVDVTNGVVCIPVAWYVYQARGIALRIASLAFELVSF